MNQRLELLLALYRILKWAGPELPGEAELSADLVKAIRREINL